MHWKTSFRLIGKNSGEKDKWCEEDLISLERHWALLHAQKGIIGLY